MYLSGSNSKVHFFQNLFYIHLFITYKFKYFKPFFFLLLIIMAYRYAVKQWNVFRCVSFSFVNPNYCMKIKMIKCLKHFSLRIITIIHVHFINELMNSTIFNFFFFLKRGLFESESTFYFQLLVQPEAFSIAVSGPRTEPWLLLTLLHHRHTWKSEAEHHKH